MLDMQSRGGWRLSRPAPVNYQSSPSFSLAGTSMTLGLSMILAVLFPFSTMPIIHAYKPDIMVTENISDQLESVAEISNLQCIGMFQYIETLRIDMFHYIEMLRIDMFHYIDTYQYEVFQYVETYQYIRF